MISPLEVKMSNLSNVNLLKINEFISPLETNRS